MDQRALRNAYGRFMTGVVVAVTKNRDEKLVGFTANSFSSVSMDPPLISVCPGEFLSSYQAFKACETFSVSILSAGQQEVASVFAGYKGDRFAKVKWHAGPQTNMPLITDSAATFECESHQVVSAGDHLILIGRVLSFADNNRPGLGYSAGAFFTL